ncbi:GNAT family N-acetyltransferase [Enterococcus massiliensis]|uniref:GNAT family N-acetyltransferase n=1 Tax=Enterococcus massiliensis TaxID=1640685 RepID=UPI00065E04C7|nr:GNAT family N-acetyltransferase [Enterococcus massiliensis]
MEIRKAQQADLSSILSIVADGVLSLKKQGLPQWQNGFSPQKEQIETDIQREESYVLINDEAVVGTAALVSGIDPVYAAIQNGSWEGSDNYLSIHRFAIASHTVGKGYGKAFLELLVNQAIALGVKDIRIDTHNGNIGMQRTIEKAGFSYRGIVKFPIPDGERKAYQWIK